jgi:hypothetical protein
MTPYLSEPRSGVAGLFLGTLNDAKWSPLAYCLDSIISVPVGAAVLQAGSAVKTKLELAPKVLSVGLNFSPFSCCTDIISPRLTSASPSASNIFPLMAPLSAKRTNNQRRLAPRGSELERGFLDFRKIDLNVYISSGLALLKILKVSLDSGPPPLRMAILPT